MAPGENRSGDLDVGLADVSAAGKTVTLDQPILAAYIPKPGAQPIGPFPLSNRGLSKVQDLLSPIVVNSGKSGLLGKLLPVAVGVGVGLLTSGGGGTSQCVDPDASGVC